MNADFEVKKLKDLVKKLELQNQHLRYKTGKLGPGSHSRPIQQDLLPVRPYEEDEGPPEEVLSDSAFRDVRKANKCSWLFSIDKQASYDDPNGLIYWLRYELDHPATQKLEFARREIISTLNAEQKISTTDSGANNPAKRAISKISSTGKVLVHEDINDSEDYALNSPPPVPREEDRSLHGHVHHMPLPSHTMTSKYGLIDVSSMESPASQHKVRPRRSASPSGAQGARGLSPSRSSHQSTYSRSRRSPVRRGQSPSRMSDVPFNSDHSAFADRSRRLSSERTIPPRYRSPSPVGRPPTPTKTVFSQRDSTRLEDAESSIKQRYRSPSPAGRAPTPSKTVFSQRDSPRLSDAESSIKQRYRSPSPAGRAPTPSKTVYSQRDSPRVSDAESSIKKRYRSPSPAGRAPTPSKTVYSQRDSPRYDADSSIKKRYRSPSPAGRVTNSSKTGISRRDSPRLSNNESLVTPRASGLRQPLTSSRLRTPRNMSSRSSGIPLTQSDIRRAASTEELTRMSEEPRSQLPKSGGYALRKALPRPSHSMGMSSPKYVSPRNRPGIAHDSVSRFSPDYTQTSPRSDSGTATNPSDVWKDGEFF